MSAWFGARSRKLGFISAAGDDQGGAQVLNSVSLSLSAGEILGIVGETGSGKTTLARCVAGLHTRWEGRITLDGAPLARNARKRTDAQRRGIELVFQNPATSLNPRHSVQQILTWVIGRYSATPAGQRRAEAEHLLELVRLPVSMLDMYPRELSGGEKQRVAIARALAPGPRLLICDEITSSLDVSVQASVVELLRDLRARLTDLCVLFISHDLAVVRAVTDRVMVMRNGSVVEEGSVDSILFRPVQPYTQALVAAPPRLRRKELQDVMR